MKFQFLLGLLINFVTHQKNLFTSAEPRCPLHWIRVGSMCYRTRYNYASKSWEDGRQWCKTQGAGLAKFDTLEQQREVVSYDSLLVSNTNFWIGIKKQNGVWKWADDTNVPPFIIRQITRAIIPGNLCGHLSLRGVISGKCEEQSGVLCQQPAGKQMRCDDSNDWQSYGNRCYYVPPVRDKWADVRDYCEKIGGTIASPRNDHDQIALYDFVRNKSHKLWIGLHSILQGSGYIWTWSDDISVPTATYWDDETGGSSNIPDQNKCAYMDPKSTVWNKSWKSASCDIAAGDIICEKPADVEYLRLYYYGIPKTWYEASRTCISSNGALASRDDTYAFDTSAWISGPGRNSTGTTPDVCPYVTLSGFSYANCNELRTFVCNVSAITSESSPQQQPSNAVIAIVILLVILVLVAMLLVVIWHRKKKRKDNMTRKIDKEQSNGISVTKVDMHKTEHEMIKENGVSSRPNSTYDHTTTSNKDSRNSNLNQNVYDHCINGEGETYDNTDGVRQDIPAADYGCVDNGQYKTVERSAFSKADNNTNYNHV